MEKGCSAATHDLLSPPPHHAVTLDAALLTPCFPLQRRTKFLLSKNCWGRIEREDGHMPQLSVKIIGPTVCACTQVCFDRPGVAVALFLFLASDGLASGEHQRPTVTLYLVDTNGSNHSLGELRITFFRATRSYFNRLRSQLDIDL